MCTEKRKITHAKFSATCESFSAPNKAQKQISSVFIAKWPLGNLKINRKCVMISNRSILPIHLKHDYFVAQAEQASQSQQGFGQMKTKQRIKVPIIHPHAKVHGDGWNISQRHSVKSR
jgi:hypothetical protein